MDTQSIQCPYCSQHLEIAIDRSVRRQTYIEDCHVCCRPIMLTVTQDFDNEGEVIVEARSEDD
ncbi:MAG: CPXCG motif-containing cysteine-rich protein [Acidobacteriota bacterium]|nr:CPXCG motif-containing cysteine-rich protein [Acidobacteriota bacterium]